MVCVDCHFTIYWRQLSSYQYLLHHCLLCQDLSREHHLLAWHAWALHPGLHTRVGLVVRHLGAPISIWTFCMSVCALYYNNVVLLTFDHMPWVWYLAVPLRGHH